MSEEGAGETTRVKRQKIDDSDSFFRDFLKKEIERELLEEAYTSLCRGSSDMVFRILKVMQTNALLSEGFSRASCKVKMYEKERTDKKPLARLYAAGSIFKNGIYILKKFLAPNPEVPVDGEQREALRKLLNFLLQDNDSALLESEKCDEAQWAVRVAQHLLLPLTVADSYTIDDYYDGLKKILPQCPCKTGERINGSLGDTSFGWIDGWHGRSDILVNSVAVDLAYPDMPADDDLEVCSSVSSSVSSTEVKASSNFNEKDQQQVIAQTIVFSFLQRKENKLKGNLKHCLVPGIGISKKKAVIYSYDCDEDVLLGSTQMDIFGYKSICYNTIVVLWLALNYKIFGTGITESMKNYKAEFFNRVGSFLENYRNDVTRTLCKKHKRSEEDTGWTKNGAVEDKIAVNADNEDLGIKMKRL